MSREIVNLGGIEYVSVKKLAEVTGYSTWTIKTKIQNGTLSGIKRGRAWFLPQIASIKTLFPAVAEIDGILTHGEQVVNYADI